MDVFWSDLTDTSSKAETLLADCASELYTHTILRHQNAHWTTRIKMSHLAAVIAICSFVGPSILGGGGFIGGLGGGGGSGIGAGFGLGWVRLKGSWTVERLSSLTSNFAGFVASDCSGLPPFACSVFK